MLAVTLWPMWFGVIVIVIVIVIVQPGDGQGGLARGHRWHPRWRLVGLAVVTELSVLSFIVCF